MRKTLIGASGAVFALLVFPTMALACTKPTAPAVVDRNTLTFEQRNAMTAEIDAYIAAMNVYLACLERSDTIARAEAEQIIKTWEAPVDDLQIVQ